MDNLEKHRQNISRAGFDVFEGIYFPAEIDSIILAINNADQSALTFRKTNDLFAIRRFLKEVPGIKSLIFNEKLKAVIDKLFGDDYFVVKSIYFDKPEQSNWFVAWHQDLTIAVDKKIILDGFGTWSVKGDQFAVQPPLNILQNNFTIRIHLDDTDESNGALKVVPGSHLKNIYRAEDINWQNEIESTCNVRAGGIMVMRPLLMHTSARTTSGKQRRVINIEFSNSVLPEGIDWAEKEYY